MGTHIFGNEAAQAMGQPRRLGGALALVVAWVLSFLVPQVSLRHDDGQLRVMGHTWCSIEHSYHQRR
jgi:hypothetical protein